MIFYEWDDRKAELNYEKHDARFEDIVFFEWDRALVKEDERFDYGEDRYNGIGPMENRLYQVTFTLRNEVIRIISFRKANQREIKQYESQAKI
ncbi:MAG: BrnT family toxin [Pseudomonadota bacterium]|nr:BrnT family toxin [Pseudomonadota bacterium]